MTLQQLKYLRVLARTLHYTQAAELLHVTQPSLSYAISSLEKELGVILFQREARRIALTEKGHAFLQTVEKSLDILEDGIQQISPTIKRQKRPIRLGIIKSLAHSFIPMAVEEFMTHQGLTQPAFELVKGNNTLFCQEIKNGNLDLAITAKIPQNLYCQGLFPQQLHLIASEKHPFASREGIYLRELDRQPFIYLRKDSSTPELIDSLLRQHHIHPIIVQTASDIDTMISYVALGTGLAITPYIDNIENIGVTEIRILDYAPQRMIYLIWGDKLLGHPMAKSFKDFLITHYSSDQSF